MYEKYSVFSFRISFINRKTMEFITFIIGCSLIIGRIDALYLNFNNRTNYYECPSGCFQNEFLVSNVYCENLKCGYQLSNTVKATILSYCDADCDYNSIYNTYDLPSSFTHIQNSKSSSGNTLSPFPFYIFSYNVFISFKYFITDYSKFISKQYFEFKFYNTISFFSKFLILSNFLQLSSSQGCINVPISLNELERCEGNYCYFSQQVVLNIPVLSNIQSCLELISPDGITPPVYLKLKISQASYHQAVSYDYFTDDPYIDYKTWCSCRTGTGPSASCPQCPGGPVAPGPDNNVLCKVAELTSKQAKGCFTDGYICYSLKFQGSYRYKIYRLHEVMNPYIDLNVYILNETTNITNTYEFEYRGNPVFYHNHSLPINITLVSDTVKPPITGVDFVVLDVSAPSDFYLMSHGDVNSQNDYNARKLGWFKPSHDKRISNDLASHIDFSLPSNFNCNDNSFTLHPSFLHVGSFLTENRAKLASRIAPGSYINDETVKFPTTNYGSTPIHLREYDSYLSEGWMFVDYDNGIGIVGLDINGQPLSSGEQEMLVNQNLETNMGIYPPGYWYPYIWGTNGLIDCGGNDTDYVGEGALIVVLLSGMRNVTIGNITTLETVYGVCTWQGYSNLCPTYTPGYNGWFKTCVNVSFQATAYPSMAFSNFTFDAINGFQTIVAETVQINSLKEAIFTTSNGILTTIVEFKGFKIRFDDRNVKPLINFMESNNKGELKVNAQSTTIAGSCYLSSSEPIGLLIAQSIDLTMNPRDTFFSFTASAYRGSATFLINCGKSSAKLSISVDYDIVPKPQPDPNPRKGESGGEFRENGDSWFDKLWKSLIGPFGGVGTALDIFVSILIWVAVIIGCIILLIILYYIFKFLYMVFCKIWKLSKGFFNFVKNIRNKNSKANTKLHQY
jgi:hypothetical protein